MTLKRLSSSLVSVLFSLATYSRESAWLYLDFVGIQWRFCSVNHLRGKGIIPSPLLAREGGSASSLCRALLAPRCPRWDLKSRLSLSQCFNPLPCRATRENEKWHGKDKALPTENSTGCCGKDSRPSRNTKLGMRCHSSSEILMRWTSFYLMNSYTASLPVSLYLVLTKCLPWAGLHDMRRQAKSSYKPHKPHIFCPLLETFSMIHSEGAKNLWQQV